VLAAALVACQLAGGALVWLLMWITLTLQHLRRHRRSEDRTHRDRPTPVVLLRLHRRRPNARGQTHHGLLPKNSGSRICEMPEILGARLQRRFQLGLKEVSRSIGTRYGSTCFSICALHRYHDGDLWQS
jgi:hypothetical protein